MVSAQLGNHLETNKAGDQDTRTNSKWIQNLDVETKTVRESEESTSEFFYNEPGESLPTMTQNPKTRKVKTIN